MEFLLMPIVLSLLESPSSLVGVPVADTDVACVGTAPEYTFNVTYLAYLQPESDAATEKNPSQIVGISFIGKLKCRPGMEPKLHCRFKCARFASLTTETYKAAVDGVLEDFRYKDSLFDEASFVISPDGIEDYKFSERQQRHESFTKLYKWITRNLYLSSNLTDTTKRFQNIFVGNCPVSILIDHISTDERRLETKKECTMPKWPAVHVVERLDMKRKIKLNECTYQLYDFTASERHSFIPADTDFELESSTGELFVVPGNFTSENVNTYIVTSPNKAAVVGRLREDFRVHLAKADDAC